jgi:hypothetical protein
MKAQTQNNLFSLRVLDFPKIISWGDLTAIIQATPKLLNEMILIGDVDFELGNQAHKAISSDGRVRHDETIRCLKKIANDPKCDLILFHRIGRDAAVEISGLASPGGAANPKAEAAKGCFIATAACGSAYDPEVRILRDYRDSVMAGRIGGRAVTSFYQLVSPPIADYISDRPWARRIVRTALIRPLARWADRKRSTTPPDPNKK